MRSKKWIQPICIAVILLLTMGGISVEAKEKFRDKEKVVLVVDLSRSIAEINREYGVADALKLAGYLASAGTEIALIGVHSQVAVESGFFDPSTKQFVRVSNRVLFQQAQKQNFKNYRMNGWKRYKSKCVKEFPKRHHSWKKY